ncbi:MAG: 23S rRNA (adenine(2503)-C(2))-methyltransferase RlmN [Planctomycetes bacterium]|nr:23S rRNA (adenine(2503)-C(2))-methyltransferase RlmN [Planctomycetota bacterium]
MMDVLGPSPRPATAPRPASLFDHTPDTLGALLAEWRQPAYRARQVLEWAFLHGAECYEAMSNLPRDLRARLAAELPLYQSVIARRQESADGTTKLLLRWADGSTSECVLIPDGERRTVCVSTQVGCPVGCVFCASGLGGLQRQLSAAQIVEQAMRVRAACGGEARLSNVVFMGLGEPLANFDATLAAVRTINADWGLGIGARKITVSTVGLPRQMRRLADEKLQITLALSLHAPTDELRQQIIPWAERVTIESLIEACNYYFAATGREVTLEYILLGGLNDAEPQARALASVARRMRSNVNLLLYNPVEGLPFRRPTDRAAQNFLAALREAGINAHLRRSRGLDIDAACGQLRRREHADRTG